jgi:Flp pilus assembly pilin Flp
MTWIGVMTAWVGSLLRTHWGGPLKAKLGDERGATTLEYVVIAAIVCIAAIGLAMFLANLIGQFQDRIEAEVRP